MTNLEKYNQAFCETFEVDESQLEALKYQDVDTWDSVGHMTLISALEDTFDIMMEMEDIIELSTYVKGKELLKKYDVALDE